MKCLYPATKLHGDTSQKTPTLLLHTQGI